MKYRFEHGREYSEPGKVRIWVLVGLACLLWACVLDFTEIHGLIFFQEWQYKRKTAQAETRMRIEYPRPNFHFTEDFLENGYYQNSDGNWAVVRRGRIIARVRRREDAEDKADVLRKEEIIEKTSIPMTEQQIQVMTPNVLGMTVKLKDRYDEDGHPIIFISTGTSKGDWMRFSWAPFRRGA